MVWLVAWLESSRAVVVQFQSGVNLNFSIEIVELIGHWFVGNWLDQFSINFTGSRSDVVCPAENCPVVLSWEIKVNKYLQNAKSAAD